MTTDRIDFINKNNARFAFFSLRKTIETKPTDHVEVKLYEIDGEDSITLS
jgi:hypothetical protein